MSAGRQQVCVLIDNFGTTDWYGAQTGKEKGDSEAARRRRDASGVISQSAPEGRSESGRSPPARSCRPPEGDAQANPGKVKVPCHRRQCPIQSPRELGTSAAV